MIDLTSSDWLMLRLVVRAADADLAAGLLWAGGVAGIEERPVLSAAGEGDVELLAGVEARGLADVNEEVAGRWDLVVESVKGDAWLDEWRRWAQAWRAGSRLVVTPEWRAAPAWIGPDDLVVVLDPGRAFGSGAHATTRLCLAELECRLEPGDAVLDVGCGSGVLSVAAARLGAGRVEAIDIDAEAVRATTENAARNDVTGVVASSLTPLEEVEGRFQIVVVNIVASTLVALAPGLVHHTAPGGTIVLSGVLAGQAEIVTAALVAVGARPAGTAADGDWRALVFSIPR